MNQFNTPNTILFKTYIPFKVCCYPHYQEYIAHKRDRKHLLSFRPLRCADMDDNITKLEMRRIITSIDRSCRQMLNLDATS